MLLTKVVADCSVIDASAFEAISPLGMFCCAKALGKCVLKTSKQAVIASRGKFMFVTLPPSTSYWQA